MNDNMNFYWVCTIFLNLYILSIWNLRASYVLRLFWKDFEPLTSVIDVNGPKSLFSLQYYATEITALGLLNMMLLETEIAD